MAKCEQIVSFTERFVKPHYAIVVKVIALQSVKKCAPTNYLGIVIALHGVNYQGCLLSA
jgi:hypothetical protein